MLATLSTDVMDASDTAATLRFAARAKGVFTAPRAAVARAWIDPEPDPMASDVFDADEITQRRCIRILTPRFGDIDARMTKKWMTRYCCSCMGAGPQTARCSGTSSHQRLLRKDATVSPLMYVVSCTSVLLSGTAL